MEATTNLFVSSTATNPVVLEAPLFLVSLCLHLPENTRRLTVESFAGSWFGLIQLMGKNHLPPNTKSCFPYHCEHCRNSMLHQRTERIVATERVGPQ
jgi:hypothetical protein